MVMQQDDCQYIFQVDRDHLLSLVGWPREAGKSVATNEASSQYVKLSDIFV